MKLQIRMRAIVTLVASVAMLLGAFEAGRRWERATRMSPHVRLSAGASPAHFDSRFAPTVGR